MSDNEKVTCDWCDRQTPKKTAFPLGIDLWACPEHFLALCKAAYLWRHWQ